MVSGAIAEPITGRASITDGDTLVIRDTRVRLHGIDAPESAQTWQDKAGRDYHCGQTAALAPADHGHSAWTGRLVRPNTDLSQTS